MSPFQIAKKPILFFPFKKCFFFTYHSNFGDFFVWYFESIKNPEHSATGRQSSLVFRCSLYFRGVENEAIDGVTKACKRREQEVVEYVTAIIQEVNIANRRLRHLPSSECWLR